MCTNTEEFDLSFGRNTFKNEFGDQADWEMKSFTFGFLEIIPILNIIKIRKYNNVFIQLNFE